MCEVRVKGVLSFAVMEPCLHVSTFLLKDWNGQREFVGLLHEFLHLLLNDPDLLRQLITIQSDGRQLTFLTGT
eukprot:1806661-Rhodomonas_salina.1